MPEGLDIDHARHLDGTAPRYSQHLIISTGQADWKSRIEDEKDSADWGRLVADFKGLLGRGGEYHDPYNNIILGTSSFTGKSKDTASLSAVLFPSFKSITNIPVPNASQSQSDHLRFLIRTLLLGESAPLHQQYDSSLIPSPLAITPITTPTILICSHMSRDSRCGILGPLLRDQLVEYIELRNRQSQSSQGQGKENYIARMDDFYDSSPGVISNPPTDTDIDVNINIGLTSHVGGHVWAGNMIIYIPPHTDISERWSPAHPLAGKGIWYGRVEPKHIPGIFEETVVKGQVIKELLRGVAG
ncbi:hypothetical protein B0A52_10202 [Exophiala mesophila]|uniref:Altered inheritance of mitochondria protein 32 n=1 Tax=Exophiala mesophila TaxID=212818 RepID=A0A438MRJ6_EXOME|nr:hypothetical protein B0A52_10202 [Exophiala mesophila]